MIPSTSNHWPNHKDLLVFCLKFRLSPVCEYLNYYYKINNDYWAILEKIQTSGFEKIFRFFILSCGNFGQNEALPLETPWNCVIPLGNSKAKNENMEIQQDFFLDQFWKSQFYMQIMQNWQKAILLILSIL